MVRQFDLDPRLRILYLLAVAVGVFFVHAPTAIVAVLLVQVALWFAVGLTPRAFLRQLVKFASFAGFLIVTYAITGWSVASAIDGAFMTLRILSIILASQIARAGDPRAIASGLQKLGAPVLISACIDAVLTLVAQGGGGGRGMGGGRGTGGGRGGADEQPHESFWESARKLARGEVSPIVRRIDSQIARAEEYLAATHGAAGHDAAVIAGMALSMLGIRALKILPSIPFAPGHKLVILTPLYIIAALKTRSRFGATLTGLVMGTAAFMMGDGRFGIFEIVKHVTPGVVCDICVPFMARNPNRTGPLAWTILGGVIGAARFTTILAMTAIAIAPAFAYVILIPGFAVHTFFGLASGYVTYHLVRAMQGLSGKSSVPAPVMSQLVSDDGRTHIASPLMRESLVDRKVIAKTASEHEFAILPDVTLLGIGGQSIFDRGRTAVIPLAAELGELHRKHKIIVGVGGGTRVRHTISIAVDLGLPTGGIAQLIGAMEEANAIFLNALLAQKGSIVMQREHFWELPLYLDGGMLPIVISIPPYHFWEPPPEEGPLPTHGSDFGLFIHAEVLGMRRIIFVKDEDGLYNKDPKKHADAQLIRRTTLPELLANMPEELILDRQLFDAWKTSRHVERIQIVNGLKPGELTRALAGEDVGTVILRHGDVPSVLSLEAAAAGA
ncbi:MAG: hypothetical protein ACRENA_10305 [Vulcanimicrobiaceae bacterium]